MSLVTTDQALHICQSHLAIMSGKVILSHCVRLRHTGLLLCRNATPVAGIWFKFQDAGESSAYVLSHLMTAPAQHICQCHMAQRHSRQYWVLQVRIWDSARLFMINPSSFCLRLIEDQVNRKGLSPYPYNQLIAAYLPITVAIKSVETILSSSVRI